MAPRSVVVHGDLSIYFRLVYLVLHPKGICRLVHAVHDGGLVAGGDVVQWSEMGRNGGNILRAEFCNGGLFGGNHFKSRYFEVMEQPNPNRAAKTEMECRCNKP